MARVGGCNARPVGVTDRVAAGFMAGRKRYPQALDMTHTAHGGTALARHRAAAPYHRETYSIGARIARTRETPSCQDGVRLSWF
jgi:hypothetical protein